MEDILRTEEVAAMLGVGEQTVWRYIRSGKIPARKIGKRYFVSRETILAMVKPLPPATTAQRSAESLRQIATDLERGPAANEDITAYERGVAAKLRALAEELENAE